VNNGKLSQITDETLNKLLALNRIKNSAIERLKLRSNNFGVVVSFIKPASKKKFSHLFHCVGARENNFNRSD